MVFRLNRKPQNHDQNVWEYESLRALLCFSEYSLHENVPEELLQIIVSYARWSYEWDENSCNDESYQISSENRSVLKKISSSPHHVAVANALFEEGHHYYFTIKIIRVTFFNHISVGVVPESFVDGSSHKYLIGCKRTGGWERFAEGCRWHIGDTLSVFVDFSPETMKLTGTGTLSFSHNNEWCGTFLKNVLPPVRPAVCIFNSVHSLELIKVRRIVRV